MMIPRHRPDPARAGLTLIEMVITVGLLGALSASALMGARTLSDASRTSMAVSQVDVLARRAVSRMADQLRHASQASLTPVGVSAPWSTDRLDFRQVVGFAGDAPVLSELQSIRFEPSPGDPDDGVDNDGNGLVDEGRVVLVTDVGLATEQTTVLCNWVRESLDGEVPGNGVDDNGNGLIDEPGFCMHTEGSRLTLRLSLEKPIPGGRPVTRTVQRSLSLRNQED